VDLSKKKKEFSKTTQNLNFKSKSIFKQRKGVVKDMQQK
jgi:hypothetical protein